MIAVDAGAHLASIIRILEGHLPSSSDRKSPSDYETVLTKGPFAGLRLPNITAKANAVHIFRELVHSFLITHPHLDHLSGLAINTPGLEYGREAKAIVSLPAMIDAIKQHIFNDTIWPNLSDESDGAGFVTYRRLIEGGNPRLGSGDCRGYVSVCEGLATKCWSVSHGKCSVKSYGHQHANNLGVSGEYMFPSRRISRASDNEGHVNPLSTQQGHRDLSAPPGTPGKTLPSEHHNFVAVESSAFIIRNESKSAEIIVFGDIEPDSISINPRNHIVWDDIAPKVARGALRAIFIECSFDDSVRDEDLYGHLCPRHLIAELHYLAQAVVASKPDSSARPGAESPSLLRRKRKIDEAASPNANAVATTCEQENGTHRPSAAPSNASPATRGQYSPRVSPVFTSDSPRNLEIGGDGCANREGPTEALRHRGSLPLDGIAVHIIHVKETLMDGPPPGEMILKQLEEQGRAAELGCTFSVTQWGQSIWI